MAQVETVNPGPLAPKAIHVNKSRFTEAQSVVIIKELNPSASSLSEFSRKRVKSIVPMLAAIS